MPVRTQVLATFPSGSRVEIGDRTYIVLVQTRTGTNLITADCIASKKFDACSGDYESSAVRRYLRTTFFRELAGAVGADNILPHEVPLQAYDGTGKNKSVFDSVSLLTLDRYRQYRAFLPAYGSWWWLATRVSYDDNLGYARSVCYVCGDGIPDWDDCRYTGGVRPFCNLNSCLEVVPA